MKWFKYCHNTNFGVFHSLQSLLWKVGLSLFKKILSLLLLGLLDPILEYCDLYKEELPIPIVQFNQIKPIYISRQNWNSAGQINKMQIRVKTVPPLWKYWPNTDPFPQQLWPSDRFVEQYINTFTRSQCGCTCSIQCPFTAKCIYPFLKIHCFSSSHAENNLHTKRP